MSTSTEPPRMTLRQAKHARNRLLWIAHRIAALQAEMERLCAEAPVLQAQLDAFVAQQPAAVVAEALALQAAERQGVVA